MKRLLLLIYVLTGLLLVSSSTLAQTPTPTINLPKAKNLKCAIPGPLANQRRNHMKYLLHQRDKTMHEGIRNEPVSLAKCINCHVKPDAQGKLPKIASKQHFCHGCHEYAAVQIDCFECHADRPQKYIKRKQALSLKQMLQQHLASNDIKTPDIIKTGDIIKTPVSKNQQGVNQ